MNNTFLLLALGVGALYFLSRKSEHTAIENSLPVDAGENSETVASGSGWSGDAGGIQQVYTEHKMPPPAGFSSWVKYQQYLAEHGLVTTGQEYISKQSLWNQI